MDDYKIAFIYGKDEPERKIKDGELHMYGELSKDYIHSVHLLNYVNEYYPDVEIFSGLNPRHQPEIIAYFLVRMGHIVFFNTTKYDERCLKNHGKMGMFMMPDVITEKQQEMLKKFTNQISDYNVFMTYDIRLTDGMLDSQTYQSTEKITPLDLVNKYLDKEKTNQATFESKK